MKPLALDLSLTATGWATVDACGTLTPPKGQDRGPERLAWLRAAVLSLAADADVVVLEGYSYASKGRAVVSMGELGGVIRLALHDAGIPFVEVAPAVVKKAATGAGNSRKEAVLVAAVQRLGYEGHSNDEADALWLLELARHALQLPGATDLPKTHLAAIDPERWEAVRSLRSEGNDASPPAQQNLELLEATP